MQGGGRRPQESSRLFFNHSVCGIIGTANHLKMKKAGNARFCFPEFLIGNEELGFGVACIRTFLHPCFCECWVHLCSERSVFAK